MQLSRPRLAYPRFEHIRRAAGFFLILAGFAGNVSGQANRTWNVGAGNWNTTGSWTPANIPSAAGERAVFGNATGSTVTFNASNSTGGILFDTTAGGFTIQVSGTRTLTLNGATASWSGIQSVSAATKDQLITGASLTIAVSGNQVFRVGGGGNLTISATGGNIAMTGTNFITLNGTGAGTGLITSNLSGTNGKINKNDSGTWALAGTNTYTGNTTLTAGTLDARNNAAFGTGTLVFNGGTLTANAARTLNQTVSINATSTIGGSNDITLGNSTRAITNTGDFTLNVTNSGVTTLAGSLGLSNSSVNRTLTINGTGNTTISGIISNGGTATGGNLTYNGTGNLTLSGANTFNGTTTLTSGTIIAANDSAFGTGTASTLALNGGTLTANAARTLNNTVTINATSTIGGSNDITLGNSTRAITNTGDFVLNVTNSGTTTLAGAVGLSNSATNRTLTINGTGNTTISGIISNGGTATGGNLTYNGTGNLTLSGANTFNGTTTLTSGTIIAANNDAFGTGTASTLALNGGTVTANAARTLNNTVTINATSTIGGSNDITLGNSTRAITNTGDYVLNVTNSGVTTLAGALGLSNSSVNRTLTINGTGNTTISGIISNGGTATGGNLTYNGTGNLTLSGANTFNGTTTLTSGTIIAANDGAFGTGTASTLALNGGTLTANAARTLNNTATINATSTIGGSNDITLGNSTRAITNTGDFVLNVTNSGVTTLAGDLALSNSAANRTLTINGTGNTTISGVISNGAGGSTASNLTYNGAGTLTLSGTNTYGGITTVSSGTVAISDGSNLGAAPGSFVANQITLNGGTLATTANFTNSLGTNRGVTLGASGGTFKVSDATFVTIDSVIAGSGALTKDGTEALLGSTYSTLVLTGTNTYSGGTTISKGGLQINNGSALGTGAITVGSAANSEAALVFNTTAGNDFTLTNASPITIYGSGRNDDGALRNDGTGNVTVSPNIVLGSDSRINSGNASSNLTLQGGISGAFAFKLGGSGNATASGAISTTSFEKTGSGTVVLTGANSYGATSINATASGGTLQIGNGGTTGTLGTGDVSFIGGNTTGVLTFNRSNSYTVANNILGTGSLVQAGTGTVTLTGTNTYNGTTTINAGILSIASEAKLGDNPGAFVANQLTLNGGTLNTSATFAIDDTNRGITLGASGGTFSADSATTLTINNVIAGTGALTKTGSGNLTLNATNTFSGATSVSQGTLQVNANAPSGSAGALGNASSAVTINDGNTGSTNTGILIGAVGVSVDRNVTVENFGSGTTTVGGGISSGTGTYTGTITLNKNTTFTADGTSNIIFSTGAVVGTGGVTKTGTGNVTLSGTNLYSGGTTLSAGTLNLNNASAIGTGTLTISGGTIDNTSGGAIALSTNNAQNWNGDFTFTGTQNLDLGTGAVAMGASRQVTTTGGALTVGGAISGGGFGLTKAGAGTLVFGGTNTYDGGTTLSAGTLTVNSGATMAASTGGLTVNGGTLNLNNTAQTVSSLNGSGGTINLASGHTLTVNSSGTDSFSGAFGSSGNLTKTGSGTLSLLGDSSSYTGVTTLSGGVLNAQHNNALGTGNVTVDSGTTLQLQGGGLSLGSGTATVTLSGTGTGSGGNTAALLNVGGGSTRLNNNVVLGANTTISSGTTASTTLIVGGAPPGYTPGVSAPDTHTLDLTAFKLTVAGAASTTAQFDTNITGSGGVDVNTLGTVKYNANKNTYTGTTNVINGTLIVDTANNPFAPHDPSSTSFYGINGALVIGDGTGSANSAVVQIGTASASTNEAIKSTVPITVNSDGYLDLNGNAQNVGKLTMNGGAINGSTGGLYFDFANTSVDVNLLGTSPTSTISGRVSLTYHKDAATEGSNPDLTRTFNVGQTTDGVSDLTISGMIGNGGIIKTGSGMMTLTTSNNDYLGSTTVSAGVLNVQTGTEYVSGSYRSSLGAGDNDGSLGENTIVSSGATLQLQGGIAITNEALTISGTGYSGRGALQNVSGNNTWGGVGTGIISLAANSTITSTGTAVGDKLNIATTISSTSGNNFALIVDGAGNTTISGNVNTGNASATLTKNGSGTLVLSGDNGYQGATNITQGIVSVEHNNGLGVASTGTDGTFVTSGAELQLSGGLTVGGESLGLNGTGTGTAGAFRSVSGTNIFGGQVDIQTSSLITANNGASLDIRGGTTSTHVSPNSQTLTIGTTAQSGDVTISGNMTMGASYSTAVNLTKAGTGTLTIASTTATLTGTIGSVALNEGNITVGDGAHTATLTTGAVSSKGMVAPDSLPANTTLTIASGAQINANYTSGNTNFNGILAGAGTFAAVGLGGTSLTLGTTFTAGSLTLKVGSTSQGSTNLADYFTLKFGNNVGVTVGTLEITGDTILDFGNGNNTLSSTALVVNNTNIKIVVTNWTSLADAWYATSTINGGTTATTLFGGIPLDQITFAGYEGLTTTWVYGTAEGWLHREIRPTPEPATYGAILISGCLGLLGWRRYRGRKNTTT